MKNQQTQQTPIPLPIISITAHPLPTKDALRKTHGNPAQNSWFFVEKLNNLSHISHGENNSYRKTNAWKASENRLGSRKDKNSQPSTSMRTETRPKNFQWRAPIVSRPQHPKKLSYEQSMEVPVGIRMRTVILSITITTIKHPKSTKTNFKTKNLTFKETIRRKVKGES